MKDYHDKMDSMVTAMASIATGSLSGIAAAGGAYLGVGYLGTASTGAAISGLSGAAATNATLAWLGGGSLASGGFGIAGGTAVLGGLVAGPLLAIGGAVFASQASKEKDKALKYYNDVMSSVKKLTIVISGLNCVSNHISEFFIPFKKISQTLNNIINELIIVAQGDKEYRELYPEDRDKVKLAYALTDVLAKMINQGVMTDKGQVEPKSMTLLHKVKNDSYISEAIK